jgi:DNA-binding beta-propeller fold protein YncE
VIQVLDTSNPLIPVVLLPFSGVNSSGATGIAFSNSQNRLYVPRPIAFSDLLAIDVGTALFLPPIPASGRHVSTDPNGTRVYLLDNSSGNITAIDTATNGILGTFNGATGVYSSGVHPVNGRIYVLNQNQNNIQVFDPNAPVFSPVITIPITVPPSFIEPRINGRWMGPAAPPPPPPAPVPALSTVGALASCVMLIIAAVVMRRRKRHC